MRRSCRCAGPEAQRNGRRLLEQRAASTTRTTRVGLIAHRPVSATSSRQLSSGSRATPSRARTRRDLIFSPRSSHYHRDTAYQAPIHRRDTAKHPLQPPTWSAKNPGVPFLGKKVSIINALIYACDRRSCSCLAGQCLFPCHSPLATQACMHAANRVCRPAAHGQQYGVHHLAAG